MTHDTYCALIITKHGFSAKYDIDIDLGQQDISTYKDALKAYTSEIDALNYMAAQGWELATSYTNPNLLLTKHILIMKAS